MNAKEYIASGTLEAYVIGTLSAREQAEVAKLIDRDDEIRREVAHIEETLEQLALGAALQPKPSIKSTVVEKATKEQEAPVIPINVSSRLTFLRYSVAASLLIAIGSVLVAFTYWNKWKDVDGRLAQLIAENQTVAENYRHVNQRLDDLQTSVVIMNSSEYRKVVLNGTKNAPEALATVYWSESAQEVYLSIQNLKGLSEDLQYQLWAIIDGEPVDAGIFDANGELALIEMNVIGSKVAAFAVTIEPKGGSDRPTLEAMQVLGEV